MSIQIINIKTAFLVILSILLSHQYTIAQNSLNKDVKVIREYNPTVSDAVKIEQMPELDDTTSYHPTFKYSILSRAFETANELEPISPAQMANSKPTLLSNSYTKFGIGTQNSIFGELYYNILRSEKYTLGLSIGHTTSLGKVTLEDNSEAETPFHNTFAGLSFKTFFKDVTLLSDLNFSHNIYKYYGYQNIDPTLEYFYDNLTSINGSDLNIDNTQRISNFDIGLGFQNRETKLDKTQWSTYIKYLTFGNKTGTKQNMIDITGNIHVPISTIYFDLDAQIASYSVNFPDSIGPMFTFNNHQSTYLSFLPRLGLKFDQGYAEAGMLVAGTIGGENDEINLAPHIVGTLNIAEGIVSIFGGITGQYNLNDYASIYDDNAYISPDQIVSNSFYGIDLHGGITGNFSTTTSFTARVDYSYFNDEHFFVNKTYQQSSPTPPDTTIYNQSNVFIATYDNGSLLKVQGELKIHPNNDLSFRLFANYNGWNLENEKYAWHKPETEVGLWGQLQYNESLSFNSSITMLGKRYAKDNDGSSKKLDAIFDFNIGADYKLNKTWSFWANLNNIAAMKYYKWNGYPSYGFNLMIGGSYSF